MALHIESVRIAPANDVAYALVNDDDSCACELSIKRAIEMQRDEGVPYITRKGGMRHSSDFQSFYHWV